LRRVLHAVGAPRRRDAARWFHPRGGGVRSSAATTCASSMPRSTEGLQLSAVGDPRPHAYSPPPALRRCAKFRVSSRWVNAP
jgi:hypothetical protein